MTDNSQNDKSTPKTGSKDLVVANIPAKEIPRIEIIREEGLRDYLKYELRSSVVNKITILIVFLVILSVLLIAFDVFVTNTGLEQSEYLGDFLKVIFAAITALIGALIGFALGKKDKKKK